MKRWLDRAAAVALGLYEGESSPRCTPAWLLH